MRVTYIGTNDPTDDGFVEVFGERFEMNVPRELDAVHPKLHRNRTFVIEGGEAEAETAEVEALRAQLDAKGIAYHHKAGVAKLTALLTDAPAPVEPEDD